MNAPPPDPEHPAIASTAMMSERSAFRDIHIETTIRYEIGIATRP
jgi:hypothetical protein